MFHHVFQAEGGICQKWAVVVGANIVCINFETGDRGKRSEKTYNSKKVEIFRSNFWPQVKQKLSNDICKN